MNRFEKYLCLLLTLIGVFMLGAYTNATIFGTRDIETYRWVMTGGSTLLFLVLFLAKEKE